MVASPDTTISDGEIRDSGSEKATKIHGPSDNSTVNLHHRAYRPLSRSPSPYRHPRNRVLRSRSRSPFRGVQPKKRFREEERYDRQHHSQSQRVKSRHDQDTSDSWRRSEDNYSDSIASKLLDTRLSHGERKQRYQQGSRSHRTSISPEPYRHPRATDASTHERHMGPSDPLGHLQSRSVEAPTAGHDKHSHSQSVSNRSKPLTASRSSSQHAKLDLDQKPPSTDRQPHTKPLATRYVAHPRAL